MIANLKTLVTEGEMVTEAIITVPADNKAQALDRALNMMERYTELTGFGFSIETYEAELVNADNGLWFAVTVR